MEFGRKVDPCLSRGSTRPITSRSRHNTNWHATEIELADYGLASRGCVTMTTPASINDVTVAVEMTRLMTRSLGRESRLSWLGCSRLATMVDGFGRQPGRVKVGVVFDVVVVVGGHLTAGARTGNAHFFVVVPLQAEQAAHDHRHVASVWTAHAGDVQLAVGG